MSWMKRVSQALSRSTDVARAATKQIIAGDLSPTPRSRGPLPFWSMTSAEQVRDFVTGSDADIGGLSTCKLTLDEEGKGRFFGTLSSEIPRGGRIDRSGYAGFRNRNRPTLFGPQTWDASIYPYMLLRVRNRLPAPSAPASSSSSSSSSSNSELHMHPARLAGVLDTARAHTFKADLRSIRALGRDLAESEPEGPKFFVNIVVDGPIGSDIFQHRLWFNPAAKDQWQDVMIPFCDFVLLNTGQISTAQHQIPREKVRTVGISAVLSSPDAPDVKPGAATRDGKKDAAEQGIKSLKVGGGGAARGARRGGSFNFDLGIEATWAVGDDALAAPPPGGWVDDE